MSLLAPIVLLSAPIHGIGVTTAAAAPPTPFTQCPAVGFASSCGTLIIVNPDRSVSVYTDPNVTALDSVGGDDTLIGIENQSSQPLTALTASGPPSLFGFDGDGLCGPGISPKPTGCPFGSSTYEGPTTTLVPDPRSTANGEVDFAGSGLAPQAHTYFSLETAVTSATLTVTQGAGPISSELLGGSNPSEMPPCTCTQTSTKYPINNATGNFFHTFTDITIPGRGLPLNFQRTYNSLSASQNGPFGFGWTSSYASSLAVDVNGKVTITQENGSTVAFTLSGGAYTSLSRVLATLVKNGDGTYTFKRNDQTKYQFSAAGQLIAESDRNGYTTTLAYTGSALTKITDPAGRSVTLTYTGALVTGLASSTGRSVGYQYDGAGNLQQVTDVNGGLTKFAYYPDHTMKTMTDPNGGVVTNVYDGTGRAASQTDPMQRPTTFDYSTPGQTRITDAKGNVAIESYANNLLLSRTLGYGTPQAATWQYTYDPTLGVASITDPNSHTVRNTWDGNGNLLKHTDALGRTTSYTYDSLNDVLTVTDPIGVATTNTYDAVGNLLSTSRPVSNPSTAQGVVYTAVSNLRYQLSNNDGSTWVTMDPTSLVKNVTPTVDSTAILGATVDLYTDHPGMNQDAAIFVSDNGGADQLLAWKESGGASSFTPNGIFVHSVYAMTAGHTYTFKLKWKSTFREGAGVNIFAAAGASAPYAPTRLTAEVLPAGANPYTAVSNQRYQLSNNDGNTWVTMDPVNLVKTVTPTADSNAVLGANVDLYTDHAGMNQDAAIFASDNGGADQLLAWKESGGGGSFAPNGIFVQSVYSMTAGHTYTFKLKWKSTFAEGAGVSIFAAAGPSAPYAPTRLTVELLPAGANPYTVVSNQRYQLGNQNDGSTWVSMDPTNLVKSVSPTVDSMAILGGNADLYTDHGGYNQDLAIFVSDNGGADQLLAWKESGAPASFAPFGVFVQSVYSMTAGHTYTFKLKWKSTFREGAGVNIFAAAGPSAPYSPTRLTVQVVGPLVGSGQTATVTYKYTDSAHPGDVTSMIDQDSKTWQYGYDQYGDKNLTIDPLSDKTTYTFNADGWVLTQVSPNGYAIGPISSYTTTYDYSDGRIGGGHINGFGDVGSTTGPLAHTTTLTYDANRNLTFSTDANMHTTQKVYNLDNELIEVDRPDGSKVKTQYDQDGNVSSQIDGLTNPTNYSYDPLNHFSSVQDPLLRTTSYVYDAVGNLKTVTDPQSQVTTNGYDGADQLTSVVYSDGITPNVGPIQYDADGQRQDITDGTGKTTYTFDALHRLTQQVNGAGGQVSYGYDLRGHVTSITYPGGTNQVIRTYDDAGRLKTVKDWLGNSTTYSYDANSNLTGQAYPNGTSATFARDAANQISSIVDKKGSNAFLSLAYTQDSLGNLKSDNSVAYGYDPNNRVQSSGGSSYGYDSADNLNLLISGATQTYDAANEIISRQAPAATTFSYDSRGNRNGITPAGQQTTILAYDQTNRLKGYGTAATYAYNGDGLRMNKTVAGIGEAFTYDTAEGMPLIIQDGANSYVTGVGGLPLEQISTNGVTYYHQDQLGSTRALTSQTGNVTGTANYDAYGNPSASTPTFGYAGQYRDSESGLVYLRARYYDPSTGQFLTRDPAVAVVRQPYAYVADNPLNAMDPSGMVPFGPIIAGLPAAQMAQKFEYQFANHPKDMARVLSIQSFGMSALAIGAAATGWGLVAVPALEAGAQITGALALVEDVRASDQRGLALLKDPNVLLDLLGLSTGGFGFWVKEARYGALGARALRAYLDMLGGALSVPGMLGSSAAGASC